MPFGEGGGLAMSNSEIIHELRTYVANHGRNIPEEIKELLFDKYHPKSDFVIEKAPQKIESVEVLYERNNNA